MADSILEFYLLAVIFLIASIIFTYILKRVTKFDTYFIVTMVKTQKPLWLFDRLAFLGKWLDIMTEIGVVLGFGSISFDYLFARKWGPVKRIAGFIASTAFLVIVFLGFDALMGNSFSRGILTKEAFWIIALVFGLTGFAGFVVFSLALNAFTIIANYLTGQGSCPGIAPVLPGIEVPNVPISIPLYAWIPLFLVVIIHELMHGVVARKEKIPVKSTGILLLGFLPIGGFVEPDDKKLLEANERKQLHVYAAGVITNLIVFLLCVGVLVGLSAGLVATVGPWVQGIKYQSVQSVSITEVMDKVTFCKKDYSAPAFGVLEKGMTVLEANGKQVRHSSDLTSQILSNRFAPLTLLVELDGEKKQVTLSPNELGSFGFALQDNPNPDFVAPQEFQTYSLIVGIIFSFLYWFLIFNLLLGMVNYLPVPFFDGGRMATIIFAPYIGFLNKDKEEAKKTISKFFIISLAVLIIINALPLFF